MDQTSESEKIHQKKIYDEIIAILLAAGYYRAQIHTLSEFDKVVGGLCWCITNSGEDVDVDILFQENSTIGQRIALSEAITSALKKMNCPTPLQPHQIQGGVGGSDFPAISPVIKWLVKKFIARRGEREAHMRDFSHLQFVRNYQLSVESVSTSVSSGLENILNRNKAVRKFKRAQNKADSEDKRVYSCLLEYGDSFASVGLGTGQASSASGPSAASLASADSATEGAVSVQVLAGRFAAAGGGGAGGGGVAKAASAEGGEGDGKTIIRIGDSAEASLSALMTQGASDLSGFERKLAQAQREALREEQLFAEQASKVEAELMQQMKTIGADDSAVISGSQVGAIVHMGSSEIGSAAAAYQAQMEEAKRQMDSSVQGGKLGQLAAFKRQKQNLLKVKEEAQAKSSDVDVVVQTLSKRFALIDEERSAAAAYSEQLQEQLKKLGQLESASSQREELAMLKKLVGLNESLKGQEAAFKASCKAQMADLTAKIKALDDSEAQGVVTEEDKKLADIEEMYSKVIAKYNRLRQVLAETNLDVANTTRTIDDIPTRTELIQYERRFAELYQQVAWKLDETKKYYSFYNTLEDTLSILQKEVKIINTIGENFDAAMQSKASKQEYLSQCDLIVRGVEQSLAKEENKLSAKLSEVEQLKVQYQALVDQQRRYFKTVKDFQDECTKNEWLSSKLEQMENQ